ncbi:hypothetical protein IAQ61_009170 [Plenodomus lingam]|uniref:Predicted protein n=1 Tax=Leptosphaeria maculans (strain JN3 / isolate v23.1.3 / race Av1-4-5-6-7-8) TaxID=985895 RepID=E4ZPU1_LEPMJ|nr:predicted protein [Plenodomus lingam JN3]KAH9865223.1 hypothetical protein IAQ61_009170 [Plenodomus lingam]CBX93476.1 predicted protein [Plenodomus lingam JN3]
MARFMLARVTTRVSPTVLEWGRSAHATTITLREMDGCVLASIQEQANKRACGVNRSTPPPNTNGMLSRVNPITMETLTWYFKAVLVGVAHGDSVQDR